MPKRLADAPDVLTVEGVAYYMQSGMDAVYKLIRDGDLYAIKVGRGWRIPKSAVLAMLEPTNS